MLHPDVSHLRAVCASLCAAAEGEHGGGDGEVRDEEDAEGDPEVRGYTFVCGAAGGCGGGEEEGGGGGIRGFFGEGDSDWSSSVREGDDGILRQHFPTSCCLSGTSRRT